MKHGVRFLIIIVFGAIMIGTYGCATVTKGSSQSVTISTDPTGAACTLSREGSTIAIVNPTPGTVNVDKDKDTVSVLCKKDGYQDGTGVMEAKFQGMTFGNILLGGLIGFAIDAGSGAMHRYDPVLSIFLIPQEFRSTSEKDAFFDRMRADWIAEISKSKEHLTGLCYDNEPDEARRNACEMQKKALETEKEKRLAEIEQKRSLARVLN